MGAVDCTFPGMGSDSAFLSTRSCRVSLYVLDSSVPVSWVVWSDMVVILVFMSRSKVYVEAC